VEVLTDAQRIFDKALSLKEGERILIPFLDEKDRESFRVSLYRERSKFREKVGSKAPFDVKIQRFTDKGRPCIILSLAPSVMGHVQLLLPSGERKPLIGGDKNGKSSENPRRREGA